MIPKRAAQRWGTRRTGAGLFAAAALAVLPGCGGGSPADLPPAVERRTTRFPGTDLVQLQRESYLTPEGDEVFHGAYEERHRNGARRAQGAFRHGQRVGTWTAWHDNGQTWVAGQFESGQPVGKWRYYDPQGRAVGERIDGVKVGRWRERNIQGDSLGEGEYVDGQMHGPWSFVTLEGAPLCEAAFESGVLDGPAAVHGLVSLKFQFQGGREQPQLRQIVRDGKTFAGDDPVFGEVVRSYSAPDFRNPIWLAEEGPFDPPQVYVQRTSWRDGEPRWEVEFRLGRLDGQPVAIRHGRTARWFPGGAQEAEFYFLNGLEEGPAKAWRPGGGPRFAIEFTRGRPTGEWTFWNRGGRRIAQGEFRGKTGVANWTMWDDHGKKIVVSDIENWVREHLRLEGDDVIAPSLAPAFTRGDADSP